VTRRDPNLLWSTGGMDAFEKGSATGVLTGWQDRDDTSVVYIDTAQCFQASGALDVLSFCSIHETFHGLRIQLWHPISARPSTKHRSFRLVAETDAIDTSKFVRRVSGDGGLLIYEFSLAKLGMNFKTGDCLGWATEKERVFFAIPSSTDDTLPILLAEGRPQVSSAIEFSGLEQRHYCVSVDFIPSDDVVKPQQEAQAQLQRERSQALQQALGNHGNMATSTSSSHACTVGGSVSLAEHTDTHRHTQT